MATELITSLPYKYAIRISSLEAKDETFDEKLSKLTTTLQSKGKLIGCIEHPDGSHYHTHLFLMTDIYSNAQGLRDVIQKVFPYKADKERGFKPITISDKSKTPWDLQSSAFYMSKGPKAKALPGQEKKKTLKVYDLKTKLPFTETRIMLYNSDITIDFVHTKYDEFWEHMRLRQNMQINNERTHFERLSEKCDLRFQTLAPTGLYEKIYATTSQMVDLVIDYFGDTAKTRFGMSLIADYTNLMMCHYGPPKFKTDLKNKILEKFFS